VSICVTPLTLGGVGDLPTHAQRCVFWEIDPSVAAQSRSFSDPRFEKEAWLSTVMLEWGSCGQIVSVDGKPVGCALYSPPSAVPRAGLFPTSPVSPDAVLLTTLSVEPCQSFDTSADRLVTAVVADLVRRGVRALEAFGIRASAEEGESERGPGATGAMQCSPQTCMIDAEFLEDVGFEVVAPHHRFPRLRLELDHKHDWKTDVEHALDQLLASAGTTMLTEPVERLVIPRP
jgi:hypothetical protein